MTKTTPASPSAGASKHEGNDNTAASPSPTAASLFDAPNDAGKGYKHGPFQRPSRSNSDSSVSSSFGELPLETPASPSQIVQGTSTAVPPLPTQSEPLGPLSKEDRAKALSLREEYAEIAKRMEKDSASWDQNTLLDADTQLPSLAYYQRIKAHKENQKPLVKDGAALLHVTEEELQEKWDKELKELAENLAKAEVE